jgi:glycosyltransferase involved in cell wall biosynthesis
MCVLPFIESENGDLEGLPVVAVEAMGCMCPVIVGDIPGINDLVTDGDTGLICNSTSPEDIAVKIKMLHDNPELRNRLSQNAYNSIQKKYSWTACAENYNRLLRAVIDTEQTSRD